MLNSKRLVEPRQPRPTVPRFMVIAAQSYGRVLLLVVGYLGLASAWLSLTTWLVATQPALAFAAALPTVGLLLLSASLLAAVLLSPKLRQPRPAEHLEALADHIPDMIFRLRVYPDCRFEYVSPAAHTLTGYQPSAFYAAPDLAYQLVHPDDRAQLAALSAGRPEAAAPAELRWIRRDGSIVWIEQRTVPIHAADGRLIAIEGVARDISERNAADEQIRWQRRALERAHHALIASYEVTLKGWSQALDLRDHETEHHSARVTTLSVRLAEQMGFDGDALDHFRRGALLHDIGKLGIPDAVLHKPGPLTEAEWAVMRRHPDYALQLLAPIAFLRPALDIPYSHHERWDGSGYPQGLCGEQIPLAARIFAIVDVWDALTTTRPYRSAWPAERVRAYLEAHAGTLFDPAVVQAFLALPEIVASAQARPLEQRRVA